MATANQQLSQQSAADAIQRGKREEERSMRRTAQLQGSQRAAMAANGIEADFGSAVEVQDDTKRIGREEAGIIRENAMRETRGFEIEAANFGASAKGAQMARTGALVKLPFDVGNTILGGARQYRQIQSGRSGAGS